MPAGEREQEPTADLEQEPAAESGEGHTRRWFHPVQLLLFAGIIGIIASTLFGLGAGFRSIGLVLHAQGAETVQGTLIDAELLREDRRRSTRLEYCPVYGFELDGTAYSVTSRTVCVQQHPGYFSGPEEWDLWPMTLPVQVHPGDPQGAVVFAEGDLAVELVRLIWSGIVLAALVLVLLLRGWLLRLSRRRRR